MPHVTLAVTGPVLAQVAAGNAFQRQIAIQGASPALQAAINVATAVNLVNLQLAGAINLTVGDSGAIWAAHQPAGLQTADFDSLYDLLARHPDLPVQFTW